MDQTVSHDQPYGLRNSLLAEESSEHKLTWGEMAIPICVDYKSRKTRSLIIKHINDTVEVGLVTPRLPGLKP